MHPDMEIVQRAMHGDQSAYTFLYNDSRPMVYKLLLQKTNRVETAEELTQETFIQAFRKLALFNGKSRFKTWIYRVAYNIFLQKIRRIKKESVWHPMPETDEGYAFEVSYTIDPVTRLILQESLQELSPVLRESFILHGLVGYSHAEIGKQLNITIPASKSRALRSREQLKALLI